MENQNPNIIPGESAPSVQPAVPSEVPCASVPQCGSFQPAYQQPVQQQASGQPYVPVQPYAAPIPPRQETPAAPSQNDAATFTDPAAERPSFDSGVQMPQHAVNPQPEIPQKRVRKRAKRERKGVGVLAVIAISLVFALLGGLGGAVFAGWYTERRLMAEMEALRDSLPVITTTGSKADELAGEEEHTESAMQHLSSDLSTNVGDKQLTPTEVYEAYVGSTVGISNEGTFTNLFGQVSETASTGSGFIITSDGYIVTNYHVIENAVKLTVTLNNEEQYEATIIGYDSGNDIALIKIDATDLRPVSIGDSDELRVGETVCAIGNPLGELTNTLTIGGVSALDREVNTDGTPINMMQTDCAINSGNSGGPLFDMNGNVIGITTAKYYGDAIEGIGFAIPINDAMRIVADLKEYGYVKGQPYMGVTVLDMNTSTAQLYKLPVGVYVNSVDPGSGAEIAGMQEGDIILALGEYEVVTMSDLMGVLKNFAAGDTTTILIYRTGEELLLTITFDEKRPAELTQQTAAETPKMPSVDEFFPEEPKD